MTLLAALARHSRARARLRAAREACPHWDHEADGAGHACCDEVMDAAIACAIAQRAVFKARDREGAPADCRG